MGVETGPPPTRSSTVIEEDGTEIILGVDDFKRTGIDSRGNILKLTIQRQLSMSYLNRKLTRCQIGVLSNRR